MLDIFNTSVLIAFECFFGIYTLWVFFLAVMCLKRAKEAGLLTKPVIVIGTPVLIAGYIIDFFVNVVVFTIIMLEFPRETTVTSRLTRHYNETSGWRHSMAVFSAQFLNPYDPSGPHI